MNDEQSHDQAETDARSFKRVRLRSTGKLGWIIGPKPPNAWKASILWDGAVTPEDCPDDGSLFEIVPDETATQPELDGMPEPAPVAVVPTWFDLCDVALDRLASAAIALKMVAGLPDFGSQETWELNRALDRFTVAVMQEVGRAAWELALRRAEREWTELHDAAARRTAETMR